VQGALKWRTHGIHKLLSCLPLLAALPFAVFCGHAIRHAIFSHDIHRWNEAVEWVKAENKPNPDHRIQLPLQYADLAYGVFYTDDDTCGLMIDFFWGGAFPVKHTVRRYAPNPEWSDTQQCRESWHNIRTLSGNWYEISD